MQSLAMKARQIGAITYNQHRWLMIQMGKHGWRKNEPVPIAHEKPQLASRVLQAFRGIGVPPDQICDVLGISAKDLKKWFFQDEGGLRLVD